METLTINASDIKALAEPNQRLAGHANRCDKRKAKLKDIFLTAEYNETLQKTSNDVKKDCTAPVHDDLKEAFKAMDNLLLKVCEQPTDSKVVCTGFTIGNDGNGATLIVYRDLESGKVLNLTGPYEKFEDNGTLEVAIEHAKSEILLYLFEGKQAPEKQGNLFDGFDMDGGNDDAGLVDLDA